VAALGTVTTQHHLRQLFRETHELVFCFDGDRAGRQAAWRAVQQLLPMFRDGLEARFMFLPEGDDPDSLVRREGDAAFLKRATAAMPLSDYIFEHLSTGMDLSSAAGRARLAELAKPLLQALPAGVFQELMHAELAKRVGTSVGKLAPFMQKEETPVPSHNLRLTTSSPVRMAIAMLLNEPRLAQQVAIPGELHALQNPGVALLIGLLETIKTNPHLNSASLVERYRNSEHQQSLLKLLTWRPPAHNFDLLMQFRHTLEKLAGESLMQTADRLLEKEAREGLTPKERRELQEAMARKGEVRS
jgi:DNA primase